MSSSSSYLYYEESGLQAVRLTYARQDQFGMGTTMQKLFLDDERDPPDSSWAVVRNYASFAAYLQEHGVPDVISFDHDLAEEHYEACFAGVENALFQEKTGYDCACLLLSYSTLPRKVIIHSRNKTGAKKIAALFLPYVEVEILSHGVTKTTDSDLS